MTSTKFTKKLFSSFTVLLVLLSQSPIAWLGANVASAAEDSTGPSASVIQAGDTITYTFNEPVKLMNSDYSTEVDSVDYASKLAIYTISEAGDYSLSTKVDNVISSATLDSTKTILTIKYAGSLIKTSTTRYVVDARGYHITDMLNNKMPASMNNTFTVAGDSTGPSASVIQAGDTITYTFNEPVKLMNSDYSTEVDSVDYASKLAIYTISEAGDYSLSTKVDNVISSATLDSTKTILTIKYAGSLIKTSTTRYVVDARGYHITDVLNNKMPASMNNTFTVAGDSTGPSASVIQAGDTITYTFNEPVKLMNSDYSTEVDSVDYASKLAIYTISEAGDYSLSTKVDNVISSATLDSTKTILTIKYAGSLIKTTTTRYVIDARGYHITDMLNNKMPASMNNTFTVAGDSTGPSASVIQAGDTITYTFNEPVKLMNSDYSTEVDSVDYASKLAIYTISEAGDYSLSTKVDNVISSATLDSTKTILTIKYAGSLIKTSTTRYVVDARGYHITDVLNNKMPASMNNTFTVAGDSTGPSASVIQAGDTITYTFNEPVKLMNSDYSTEVDSVDYASKLAIYTISEAGDYSLSTKVDNVISSATLDSTKTILTIKYAGSLIKTTTTRYVIDARGYHITDMLNNKMPASMNNTFTVAGDSTGPSASVIQAGDTITYTFNEPVKLMNSDYSTEVDSVDYASKLAIYTISEAGDYSLSTKVDNVISSATLDSTKTILTIKYAGSLIKTTTTRYVIDARGYHITDMLNNKMPASMNNTFTVAGDSTGPSASVIQAGDTITYTFNEPVKLMNSDYSTEVDSVDYASKLAIYTISEAGDYSLSTKVDNVISSATLDSTKTILTIKYAGSLIKTSTTRYVVDARGYHITDMLNNKMPASMNNTFTVAGDSTGPSASVIQAGDTITYTFNEPVKLMNSDYSTEVDSVDYASKLAIYTISEAGDYSLSTKVDNVISSATLDSTKTILTIKYAGSLIKTSTTRYVVDARGYHITDVLNNKMPASMNNTFTVAGDSTGPSASVIQAGDTITYTFNEPVKLMNSDYSTEVDSVDYASKLAIYTISEAGDYSLSTKVDNVISSATLDSTKTILTIKYAGSLIKTTTTRYVVDARGYRITDALNNKMLASPTNIFTITGVPATLAQNIIPVTTGGINITIQTGTSMTVGGVLTPVASFPTPTYTTTIPTSFAEANATIQGVVDLNFVGGAEFSKPIKIEIPVAGATSVYIKANHGLGFGFVGLTTDPNATCTAGAASLAYAGGSIAVVSGKATIYTCSASSFAAYTVSTPTSNGGGGGSSVSKDYCPNGDYSNSYYDGVCGTATVVVKTSSGEVESNLLTGTTEWESAYNFAFANKITTMKSLATANMEGNLTREQMAKMMVNYAVNILGKTVDTSITCNFSDTAKQSTEMKGYITQSCQLGLMGKNITKFMPTSTVTRAELATVLSRMLYNTEDSSGNYYTSHLKVLKDKGVITNDTPTLKETRGYVMLMLMRAAK